MKIMNILMIIMCIFQIIIFLIMGKVPLIAGICGWLIVLMTYIKKAIEEN